MDAKHALREGGEAALLLLRAVAAAADAFPPLKSAAGGALHIADTVAKFKSNKKDWAKFGQYVQNALACVIGSLRDSNEPRDDLKRNLEKLRDVLQSIEREIQAMRGQAGAKRIWSFLKDPDVIMAMRKELDDALSLFQLGSMIRTGLDVAEVLDGADIQLVSERAIRKLSNKIFYSHELSLLPYAEGASWNKNRVCLDNTRIALLEDIWQWINATNTATTAEIFWLFDVAGAGKTAVAHSIATRCHDHGLLASSFFFDRETAGRNGPQKLFSTIVRDLAALDGNLREQIGLAIERNQSLATATSRQFDELIVRPSVRHTWDRPVVIVIDALNEGFDSDLLAVLRDKIPKLPTTFRILLTSRPEDEIVYFLSQQPHIRSATINIHEQANLNDIARYVQFRLHDIAKRKGLDASWPGQQLSDAFTDKSERLFIWAFTFSDYLRTTTNPDRQLKKLLSEHSPTGLPAEAKMDKLYSTILNTCNWDDEDFVEGYALVMGAVMAAKIPLSSSALQTLHGSSLTSPVNDILSPLGSLLPGLTDSQPIRILHLSFREFLTVRAPPAGKFYIDEKVHSQRLALLCLLILNRDLKDDIFGVGDLTTHVLETHKIPARTDGDIPEVVWYACKFWIDHIEGIEGIVSGVCTDALREFLEKHLVGWLEVVTVIERFPQLVRLRGWLQRSYPGEHSLIDITFNPDLARSFYNLSSCLADLGRLEEALQAIEEALQLYRQLVADRPAAFTPDLARSLNNFSIRLADLGRREEALQAIEEALELYRQLAADRPAAFTPDLAYSLNNFSHCLADLGRREEALQANEEALKLRRQLAADRPAAFTPDLAYSLNNFSHCLADLGCREEALQAIEEALQLYRQLVADRPAAFAPDLARSLNNFSLCLTDLGRREEALQAIEEALQLYRQLVADRPAAFTPDLARSLNNFSIRLVDLGRREEALQAIEEALELYRQLAADRPAAFTPDLARSLNDFSLRLADLGGREEALQANEEALKLRRQLAADWPAAFAPDLASSLNNFSLRLADLGCREEALEAIEEALELYRQLTTDRPAAFTPDLATSLNNFSLLLADLGRPEEAVQAVDKAVKLHRQLARDRPAVFNSNLAQSLEQLSRCLSDLGREDEARQITQEVRQLGESAS